MARPNARFRITQGQNKSPLLRVFESAVGSAKTAKDLTGYRVHLHVASEAGETALLTKTSDDPAQIEILNQTTNRGQARIKFIPTDTEDLLGSYEFDIWLEEIGGSGEKVPATEVWALEVRERVTKI